MAATFVVDLVVASLAAHSIIIISVSQPMAGSNVSSVVAAVAVMDPVEGLTAQNAFPTNRRMVTSCLTVVAVASFSTGKKPIPLTVIIC